MYTSNYRVYTTIAEMYGEYCIYITSTGTVEYNLQYYIRKTNLGDGMCSLLFLCVGWSNYYSQAQILFPTLHKKACTHRDNWGQDSHSLIYYTMVSQDCVGYDKG